VIIALIQLAKTAANTKMSALAQVTGVQKAISEIMLNYDDLLAIVYPKSSKEGARKAIFLTILINNASLAYMQIKLGVIGREQGKVFRAHLRKEFEKSPELRQRLEITKDAYDKSFISFILDP